MPKLRLLIEIKSVWALMIYDNKGTLDSHCMEKKNLLKKKKKKPGGGGKNI